MLIGIDPFIGNKGIFFLHGEIIDNLKEIGFSTLNQIKRPRWVVLKGGYWLNSKDIGFSFIRFQNGIIILIRYLSIGIKLNDYEDRIVWVWDKKYGDITTKIAYEAIINSISTSDHRWWYRKLWNWTIPRKSKCIFFLVFTKRKIVKMEESDEEGLEGSWMLCFM